MVAAAHQQQQQQQKQLDDINRAVMFQRLQQAANVRQGPPMGMVSANQFFFFRFVFLFRSNSCDML